MLIFLKSRCEPKFGRALMPSSTPDLSLRLQRETLPRATAISHSGNPAKADSEQAADQAADYLLHC